MSVSYVAITPRLNYGNIIATTVFLGAAVVTPGAVLLWTLFASTSLAIKMGMGAGVLATLSLVWPVAIAVGTVALIGSGYYLYKNKLFPCQASNNETKEDNPSVTLQ